jgi:hypothetical protein
LLRKIREPKTAGPSTAGWKPVALIPFVESKTLEICH